MTTNERTVFASLTVVGLMIIVAIIITIAQDHSLGSSSQEPKSDVDVIRELVFNHLDRDFSKKMSDLYLAGKIQVGIKQDMGAQSLFGLTFEGNPIIQIGGETVDQVRGSKRGRKKAMVALRHEFDHYLRWKEYGDELPGDASLEQFCKYYLVAELPVYKADCDRMERWWGTDVMVELESLCTYQDDPLMFQKKFAERSAKVYSGCLPSWGWLIKQ